MDVAVVVAVLEAILEAVLLFTQSSSTCPAEPSLPEEAACLSSAMSRGLDTSPSEGRR